MSTGGTSDALRQLLTDLPARVPPERIDRVWIFPPRDLGGKESGLVVLSLLDPADRAAPARQVVTIRYEAELVKGKLQRADTLLEQGWAPAERVPRLIEGVLRRLGGPGEDPIARAIEGRPDRWLELLHHLGTDVVDRPNGE